MNEAIDYSKSHENMKIIIEVYDLHAEKMPSIERMRQLQEETHFFYDFIEFSDFIDYASSTEPFSEEITDDEGNSHTEEWRRIMYHYAATTWNLIKILKHYRTSDIIVGEPLVFQSQQLHKLRRQGFTIRANPHICMNSSFIPTEENALLHFWVLPQHINLYDSFIDVFELDISNSKQEIELAKLYRSDYPYALNLLFQNFQCGEPIYGTDISEEFVRRRLNCKQVCQSPLGGCHDCLMPFYKKKLHSIQNK